ncbi:MAG: hypothetical protein A2W23_02700 [Planctomycetes bacterium RBG_16_43_13]|nr:MAG: hypothetical protein A2W23_02700 [Planctomycetes bacterium RBG_16_43_13]
MLKGTVRYQSPTLLGLVPAGNLVGTDLRFIQVKEETLLVDGIKISKPVAIDKSAKNEVDPSYSGSIKLPNGIALQDAPGMIDPWSDNNFQDKSITRELILHTWVVNANQLPPTVIGRLTWSTKEEFTKIGTNQEETDENGVTITQSKPVFEVIGPDDKLKKALKDGKFDNWIPE